MDIRDKAMFLVYQFLEESGYQSSLSTLIKESGVNYKHLSSSGASGQLVRIVDRVLQEETKVKQKNNKPRLDTGDGSFVNKELCSFSNLANGANILVAQLTSDVLIAGCATGMLCATRVSAPIEATSAERVTDFLPIHKAGVVCLDVHSRDRNLILTGSMDKTVCMLDLNKSLIEPLHTFRHHKKYVVRVKWSPSGKYFVSASYDKTICVYRCEDGDWEFWRSLPFSGNVEALDFKKESDALIVGIRDDHRLHIYNLATDNSISKPTYLNMNEFGDDYVSFTALDVSVSPCGKLLLVSTDRGRLILFHVESGELMMSYYGILNDEYSQPRHCWDPFGRYFYSTSDDKCIIVFELATATIVHKLSGHTGRVRHISFSKEHDVLVSSSFDGSVKLWMKET